MRTLTSLGDRGSLHPHGGAHDQRLLKARQSGRNEDGFTLIELLIVIVILGVLSAIVVFSVPASPTAVTCPRARPTSRPLTPASRPTTQRTAQPGAIADLVVLPEERPSAGTVDAKIRVSYNPATVSSAADPSADRCLGEVRGRAAADFPGPHLNKTREGGLDHAHSGTPDRQPHRRAVLRPVAGRWHRPAAVRRPAADAAGRRVLDPGTRDHRADRRGHRSLLAEVLTPEQAEAWEASHEYDFSFSWRDHARIRGNAFTQRGLTAVALRMIPRSIPSPEDLGLPPVLRDLALRHQGLVLMTGPTGSGKSTTLASLIDLINRTRACHIITIEDPIEYIHDHKLSAVNQREVGTDTANFTDALRSVLREDPDVLLVGEMRDLESIRFALTVAETGHLVFATLHTNDTAQSSPG